MSHRKKTTVIVAALFFAVCVSVTIGGESYIFVDGSCGNDAWTGRYSQCFGPDGYKRTIQAALDAIPDGGVVVVRAGTYSGDGNRDLDFHGKAVRLIGGDCIIDCGGTPSEQHRAFHFYSGETESSTVQGFTMINGRAWKGGAVLCTSSSPRFLNCTFQDNEATDDDTGGGAVYNEDSSPIFENCTFADNIVMPSASFGGGITNERSSPTLTDCTFTNNEAWGGGGIYNTDNSNPVLENCTFLNNQAARGAGMGNSGCAPTLSRCIFTGNSASYYGGGINNLSESSPILSHCTFANNSARSGAGITNASSSPAIIINCLFVANSASDENGAAVSNDTSDAQLINCTIYGNSGGGIASFDNSRVTTTNTILWANGPSQIYNDDPACNQILYSCLEGGWSGVGNTAGDPLFADPDGPDDTLGTEDDDFSLTVGSACIDAGDNSVVPPTLLIDLAGLARFADDLQTPDTGSGTPPVVDMGVREFQGLFYVDDTAVGANNGTSWANAFTSLQNALAAASSGAEIRIAQGFYAPDLGHGITRGDRNATFDLISDLTLRGGYAGFGSPDPDDRNIYEYRTILTGDLSGNDQALADPGDLLEHPSRSENSFHVVTAGQDAQDVILDGLIITGGNADGDYASGTDSGAGIYKNHYQNSAVIRDCTFIANSAVGQGGGVFNDGPLTVDRCRFLGNSAETGGAMENNTSWDNPATLTNCLFTGNMASDHGGAIATICAVIRCTNCTFSLNRAEGTAYYRGGGITGDDDTEMYLTNCLFWANSDTDGMVESSQINQDYISQTHVNYCCVQGWTGVLGGEGNFGNDPLFIDSDGEDNTAGTEDDNTRLATGSPCINSGDPDFEPFPGEADLDGFPRLVDDAVDVGAYENQGDIPEDGVIYVDDNATGANNGSSWANAFKYLQDALAAAGECEIRVAQGTYKPDRGAGITPGSRDATFQLINNVTLKGGYAGLTGPDPDARDIAAYQTILSGDLAGNDIEVTDPAELMSEPTRAENSYRLVTGSSTNETAILDGFIITAGNANYPDFSQCNGAGMYNDQASPTVIDCTFIMNFAGNDDGGGLGAAIFNYESHPVLTGCKFIANAAIALDGGEGCGGAMGNWSSNPTLTNCRFLGNVCGRDGGGMWNNESNPVLVNCLFAGNLAREGGSGSYGGGMWSYGGSTSLVNCTFAGNTARSSQIGQAGGGIYAEYLTALTLTNCILWANISNGVPEEAAQICIRNGTMDIGYCCVQGWTGILGGEGNFGDDPLFVDADGTDNIPGTEDDNTRPAAGSPCIDSGDPEYTPSPGETDLDGYPRLVNSVVDVGAYENQGDIPEEGIIYVDDDAAGANNGSSWANAFNYLQDAIGGAESGDEIRVAQGTYRPDRGAGITPGNRDATFRLVNNIVLKGGYAGLAGPDPDARDIAAYQTVLSGDLSGNDIEVANAAQLLDEPTRSENSRNVVTAAGCDRTAVIDGFTITGGNANGPTEVLKYGGGIYDGMPTIRNCTLIGNSAAIGGGAMYFSGSYYNAQSLITDCIITHNAAATGGGIYGCPELSNCVINANAATMYSGGGVFLGQGCDTTVTDCTFSNNSAVTYGGGVMLGISGSAPIFTRCIFIANSAEGSGGAVASDGCTCGAYPKFHQCTFTGNTADAGGGAVYSFGYSLPTLLSCLLTGNHSGTNGGAFSHGWGAGSYMANCTIANNTAGERTGGIFYEESYSYQQKVVANCILWGNSDETSQTLQDQQIFALGTGYVDHSCIEGWTGMGGTAGVGNTAQDPRFVDADGPDGIPGNEDDNLRLEQDSPCINRGNNGYVPADSKDRDGNSRILEGRVDMGAYEHEFAALIAHWKLDESEGDTAEDSAGDNDGVLHGGPLWLPGEGRIDGALLFDGDDDYVDCGDGSDFDITGQITVAAWVNIRAVNMDWQTVIAKGDSAWRLSTAEDEYRYHFAVTGGPPWNYINGDIVVEADEWHHVCGTYDGANLRLYIDCVEDPAGPVPEPNGVTVDDYAVYIGENQERPGRQWDGLIDDVRVYNYALSPAEISRLCKIDVLYVDKDARGLNNGCCWADAFQCLQDAIAAAMDGTEIRVAEGTYRPDCGDGITLRDRTATFGLKNGVTIKGGYAGYGQPQPDARNIDQYPTILSGDLLGNDGPEQANRGDNSRHVVTGSSTDNTAVLDGVTITAGYADGIDSDYPFINNGAGIYNHNGSPTLLDCTFTENIAVLYDYEYGGLGAAIYNLHGSPVIRNCTFRQNSASGGHGAVCNESSSPMISDCTFEDNDCGGMEFWYETGATVVRCSFIGNVTGYGSGINCEYGSSPSISDCVFAGNVAWYDGGALRCYVNCTPVVTNCIFAGNKTTIQNGGAICALESSPVLANCTFIGNSANRNGGAIHCYRASHPKVANSILWGNYAADGSQISLIYYQHPGEDPCATEITLSYCNVQGGLEGIFLGEMCYANWGPGNIVVDPCFVSPGYWDSNATPVDTNDDYWVDGDYHLKSFGWRWDTVYEEWTFDRVTSRCIDAGCPGSPLLDEPLSVPPDPNNDYAQNIRINMGAYGGTAQASMPPYDWALLADINNDGLVDFYDFAYAGQNWQLTGPQQPCDLDRNGTVAPPDLDLFADDWLKETTWRE